MAKQISLNPKVTVLMPVYNGDKYLRIAIKSILSQTFCDFEFLIILEPSSDRSEQIIKTFNDSRIFLVKNSTKLGLSRVLNQGLDLARGEYIARMDCDDISLPQRLKEQVAYLDKHKYVDVCGTWAINLLPSTESVRIFKKLVLRMLMILGLFDIASSRPPQKSDAIKAFSLMNPPFNHPTVMMRANALRKFDLHYATNLQFAEDYDFWQRLLDHCRGVNLPKFFYYYRIHASQFGTTYKQEQHAGALHVQAQAIKKLGVNPSSEELRIHRLICNPMTTISVSDLHLASNWFNKLQQANRKVHYYPEPAFSKLLVEKWTRTCGHSKASPFYVWNTFWRSPLQPALNIGVKNFVKLILWLIKRK